jgi:hypothetical protein
MSKPDFEYPAILADVHTKHSNDTADRAAATASYAYHQGLVQRDEWGRFVYHPSLANMLPRCFPAPKVGQAPPDVVERYLARKVMTPGELPQAPKPRTANPKIEAAIALEKKWTSQLARGDKAHTDTINDGGSRGQARAARKAAIKGGDQ